MRRRFALAVVCAVALTVSALAQKKPDFSGTWVIADAAAAGGEMTIKQKADSFIVERQGPSGAQVTSYKLDNTEQIVTSGQMKMKARPHWDGEKIAIDLTRPAQDGSLFTTTIIYSLDSSGQLTVDMPSPMGNRKAVYKKKPVTASR
jgi:hypothetical protein